MAISQLQKEPVFLLLESRNSGLCGWGVRNSSQVSAGEAIAPDAPCGLEQLHRHGHGLGLAGLWEWAAWPASLGQGLQRVSWPNSRGACCWWSCPHQVRNLQGEFDRLHSTRGGDRGSERVSTRDPAARCLHAICRERGQIEAAWLRCSHGEGWRLVPAARQWLCLPLQTCTYSAEKIWCSGGSAEALSALRQLPLLFLHVGTSNIARGGVSRTKMSHLPTFRKYQKGHLGYHRPHFNLQGSHWMSPCRVLGYLKAVIGSVQLPSVSHA